MAELKLFSWNVNGIRAVINKGLLAPFIDACQPDIWLLQETKAARDQVVIDLPGYIEYWHSAEKKGYSGTAIFSKVQPVSVINGMGDVEKKHDLADKYGDTTKEGRVITAEFEKYYLVSVYTPNAKDDLTRLDLRQRWDKAFLEFVGGLEKKKPVIFAGDLNVAHNELDLARPKENEGKKGFTKEERSGFEQYLAAGWLDTFRLFNQEGGNYTWWTHWANARARNVGWRIDYFMASAKLKPKIKAAGIHADVFGSDHCPVSLTLET
jgi:exodeoxyribonuclease-3